MSRVAKWFKQKHGRIQRERLNRMFEVKYRTDTEGGAEVDDTAALIADFQKNGGAIRRFDERGKPIPCPGAGQ